MRGHDRSADDSKEAVGKAEWFKPRTLIAVD